MKTILFYSFLLILFLTAGCKKEAEQGMQNVEINAVLTATEEFRAPLKQYIHEHEFPLITQPPAQYSVSRILYADIATGPVYQFISDGRSGRQKVIIKIIKEHEHDPLQMGNDDHEANDDYTSIIITINFLIQ